MPIPSLTMRDRLIPRDTPGPEPAPERLLSLRDVQRRLGVSKPTVLRSVQEGRLVVIRIGRRTLVHPDDLARFIDCCREEAA